MKTKPNDLPHHSILSCSLRERRHLMSFTSICWTRFSVWTSHLMITVLILAEYTNLQNSGTISYRARFSSMDKSVCSRCDGSSDRSFMMDPLSYFSFQGARCSSMDKSVCSWCDGSSDRSFMMDPLSYFSFQGARCSSMVRGVVGSILHDGPIELYLVPRSQM